MSILDSIEVDYDKPVWIGTDDDSNELEGKNQTGEHIHDTEDCEFSDCVVCENTVRRCELDDNLQCPDCK